MARDLYVNCPWCAERGWGPDHTRNLAISTTKTGVYHCWRCGAKPSVTGPLPGKLRDLAGRGPEGTGGAGLGPQPSLSNPPCSRCEEYARRRLPRGYPLRREEWPPPWLRCIRCGGHRLGFIAGSPGWWQGRATSPRNPMPYLNGWSGRGRAPTPVLEMVPRRVNHPGRVLVEGPMDGLALWWAGLPAVVLFGKDYSPAREASLQDLGPRWYLIALDWDAPTDALRWAARLSRWVDRLHVYWLPAGLDPADLDRSQLADLAATLARLVSPRKQRGKRQ